jgi:hypothetical protein
MTAGLAVIAAAGTRAHPGRAAEGTTTLLSVGIALILNDPFAWRLVRDTAPAFGEGDELERALGFVYSPDGGLRVTAVTFEGSGLVVAGTIGPPNGNTQVFYPITLTPENPTVSITLSHPA